MYSRLWGKEKKMNACKKKKKCKYTCKKACRRELKTR